MVIPTFLTLPSASTSGCENFSLKVFTPANLEESLAIAAILKQYNIKPRPQSSFTEPRDANDLQQMITIFYQQNTNEHTSQFIYHFQDRLPPCKGQTTVTYVREFGSSYASMSRRFRPTSLGSQSGIYSVRGSELARSGNTTPNKIRCVVELLDDSEFVIDIDVSKQYFLLSSGEFHGDILLCRQL